MHTGMLWFDNSTNTLENKIKKAAEYYTKKYGLKPNLCLVHPSMGEKTEFDGIQGIQGIQVRPYRPILPGHIWIGIDEV